MLSSREVAGLIWLGIFTLAIVGYRPTRRSLPGVLRALAKVSILTIFVAYFSWIAAGVYLAHLTSAWYTSMLGPTILWGVFTGVPLMFDMTKAAEDPRWLIKKLRALFSLTLIFEFAINFRTFHLAGEFILQGVLGFFLLLAGVASTRPEHQAVEKYINWLLGVGSLLLCVAGVVYLASAWNEIHWLQATRNLLMPVWLGAWAAVFVATFGLYANLEQIFRLMRRENQSWASRFWRILLLAYHVGLRPRTIRKYHGYWCNRLANAPGLHDAKLIVNEFVRDQAYKDSVEEAAAQKLIDNAGLKGADENGAQIDQREFNETWSALETIMLWFHGWYGRNIPGYDLLKIQEFMSSHEFKGLPENHGITAHVSEKGESCYAMRRTITGRVLAVGLHGHEFREWHWDGDHEPNGYPGEGGDWGVNWATHGFNPNR